VSSAFEEARQEALAAIGLSGQEARRAMRRERRRRDRVRFEAIAARVRPPVAPPGPDDAPLPWCTKNYTKPRPGNGRLLSRLLGR
jgi:hypothetical protein